MAHMSLPAQTTQATRLGCTAQSQVPAGLFSLAETVLKSQLNGCWMAGAAHMAPQTVATMPMEQLDGQRPGPKAEGQQDRRNADGQTNNRRGPLTNAVRPTFR